MILFDNKVKIKWERDNFIKRKKKIKAQLPANKTLKDKLKKKSILKRMKNLDFKKAKGQTRNPLVRSR
jgi:hypothetical protein